MSFESFITFSSDSSCLYDYIRLHIVPRMKYVLLMCPLPPTVDLSAFDLFGCLEDKKSSYVFLMFIVYIWMYIDNDYMYGDVSGLWGDNISIPKRHALRDEINRLMICYMEGKHFYYLPFPTSTTICIENTQLTIPKIVGYLSQFWLLL
jgi:hypothetical protein